MRQEQDDYHFVWNVYFHQIADNIHVWHVLAYFLKMMNDTFWKNTQLFYSPRFSVSLWSSISHLLFYLSVEGNLTELSLCGTMQTLQLWILI